MTEKGEPNPPRSSRTPVSIISLHRSDVLLGKGSGYTEYVGNQSFLSLIEGRKEAYNFAAKNKEKARLANEFLDHIHSLGGRFLKRHKTSERSQRGQNIIENSTWYEVDEKTALDKIKQAFRQNRDYKERKSRNANTPDKRVRDTVGTKREDNGGCFGYPSSQSTIRATSSGVVQGAGNVTSLSTSASVAGPGLVASLMPLIALGSTGFPVVDYSFMLSLDGSHSTPPLPIGRQSPTDDAFEQGSLKRSLVRGFEGMLPPDMHSRRLSDSILRSQSPIEPTDAGLVSPGHEENTHPENGSPLDCLSMPEESPMDEDEAAFVLSSLGLSDRPTITVEQLESEKSKLTEEERARLLSDLFGKQCSLGIHKSKRARRDFESDETLGFLLLQMRAELRSIPPREKQALLEAERKSREDEFGDSRLKHFLRADGMNPKAAAKRFVKYWESRRELFGQEKYHLRMTLSEILCDEDIVALEAGLFSILPYPDSTGRPLVFIEPPRNTGNGYTPKNMVRSFWYLMEIMVREYAQADGNYVYVVWDKDSKVWDYDHYSITNIAYYHRYCWPIREMPSHSCCSSLFVRRIVKPVMIATMGKDGRCRTIIHDVPESKVLDALAEYGIGKEVLPASMGGPIDLDRWLPEFTARRRAIEMEEL